MSGFKSLIRLSISSLTIVKIPWQLSVLRNYHLDDVFENRVIYLRECFGEKSLCAEGGIDRIALLTVYYSFPQFKSTRQWLVGSLLTVQNRWVV